MTAMTYFYQGCPVCGRNLRIAVKHFGRKMACTHCQGEFVAGKDELPAAPPSTVAAAITSETTAPAAKTATLAMIH